MKVNLYPDNYNSYSIMHIRRRTEQEWSVFLRGEQEYCLSDIKLQPGGTISIHTGAFVN